MVTPLPRWSITGQRERFDIPVLTVQEGVEVDPPLPNHFTQTPSMGTQDLKCFVLGGSKNVTIITTITGGAMRDTTLSMAVPVTPATATIAETAHRPTASTGDDGDRGLTRVDRITPVIVVVVIAVTFSVQWCAARVLAV